MAPRPRPGARRWRLASLALVLALASGTAAGTARADDFFGPSTGLQLQPEVDVIGHVGGGFRLVGKLEPTWIPSPGYGELGFSLYGEWLVAPITGSLLSPDLAKRRRLDVRAGISWFPTVAAGTQGWSDVLQVEGETTMRTNFPGDVLGTLRFRAEARWQLEQPTSFMWRLRLRPQLEREFPLSADRNVSLTPFANCELMWTTQEDMWAQFRMQVGLQLGLDWFGRGQVIELNGQVITYLQPTRTHAPTLGLVWYQYF
jgi:hypothetical protein